MKSETFHRYLKGLLIFFGVSTLLTVFTLYGRNAMIKTGYDINRMDVTPLLPIEGGWGGLCILLFFIPISASSGAIIGGYVLSPVYLLFHKLFYRKMKYGIQKVPQSMSFKHIYKGLYPALLSVNINSMIIFSNPGLLEKVLVSSLLLPDVDFPLRYALGSLVLMMFTIGLSMFVFSPAWFLVDAGIVYSTYEYVRGRDLPFEVRAVGGWFYDYIKGYAGFSVAFSYLQLVLVYYYFEILGGYAVDIVEIIFIFGIPLFITLLLIPSFILFDIIKDSRTQFVRRIAKRMGITKYVETTFKEIE